MSQPWGYVPSCAAEFPNDNPALHEGVTWVCLRVSGPPRPVARPRAKSLTHGAPPVLDPVRSSEPAPALETVVAADPPEQRLAEGVLGVLLETLNLELPEAPAEDVPAVPSAANETLDLDAILSLGDAWQEDFVFDSEEEQPSPPPTEELARSEAATETVVAHAVTSESETAAKDSTQSPDAFAALVSALVGVALGAGATRAAAVLPELLERGSLDVTAFGDDVRDGLVAARILDASFAPAEGFLAATSAWRRILRGESSDFSACGTSTLDEWGTATLKAFGVGQSGKVDVRRELRRRGVAAFGMLLAA